MGTFHYGWKRQAPDPRDLVYRVPRRILKTLPANCDLTSGMGPLLDQGNLGSCFPAGTLIRLADGHSKPIEEIRILDKVVTAEGRIGRVISVMARREDKKILKLSLWGHNYLRLTEEHPVLTKRGYIAAKDLTRDDWVAMPRYLPANRDLLYTENHVRWRERVKRFRMTFHGVVGRAGASVLVKPVPDLIKLTPGFGYVMGLFLSEGDTSRSKVVWHFHAREETTLAARLIEILGREFELETRLARRGNNSLQVSLYGTAWAKLFESLCLTGAGNKRLHPEIASGPPEFMKELLQGWLDGDGHDDGLRKRGKSVSHALALGMFDIAQALGLAPTINWMKPGQNKSAKHRRPVWVVSIASRTGEDLSSPKKGRWHKEITDSHVWRKVRGLEEQSFRGYVFNLSVHGDNSYVAEGVGVHNCGPNTADECITFDEGAENLPLSGASRLFVYYNTRVLMGTVSEDSGVDNRTMLKALAQYGFCAESLWPYDISQFTVKPPQAAYDAAQSNHISNYAVVQQTLSQMQGTLVGRHPFIFGFDVFQQMESGQAAATGIVTDPGPSDTPIGGHDVSFVGYNATGGDLPGVKVGNSWPAGTFKFRNHWRNPDGTWWGDGGYGYISFTYATGPHASDFWVINAVPTAGPTPPPIPGPTPPPNPGPGPLFTITLGHAVSKGQRILFRAPVNIPAGTYDVTAESAHFAEARAA